MEIRIPENQRIDWTQYIEESVPGASGIVSFRTHISGDVKIRKAVYSVGYEADHWCQKGHIISVLTGQLIIDFSNNTRMYLEEGDLCVLGDDLQSHKAIAAVETVVIIID